MPRKRPPIAPILSVALLLGSAGCTANLTGSDAAGAPGPASMGGSSTVASGGSGPGSGGTDTTVTADAPCGPAPTPLRRLTAREYGRTVNDLLGTKTDWGARLQTDVTGSGFENNVELQNMTQQSLQQFFSVAEGIATDAVNGDLKKLMGCDVSTGGESCVTSFLPAFAKRAYRRALLPGESDVLLSVYRTAAAAGAQNGVLRLLEAILMAPQFLYRSEVSGNTPASGSIKLSSWEIASRLSYLLIGTMPDGPLSDAADADALQTKEAVLAQAQRLLADPRAQALLTEFDDQWLSVGRLGTIQKDAKLFPDYAAISSLQRQELSLFIQEAFWKEGGNLRSLLTAPFTFRNAALAKYYDEPFTRPKDFNTGVPLDKVDTDPALRPGLLSQGGFIALTSAVDKTNPVFRGKFIRTQLLCDTIPPPPPSVNQQLPTLNGPVTTRQRFAAHSADPSCSGCHRLMDPIGVGLESFDPTGRYRTMDNGLPVDTNGELLSTDVDGTFNGVGELATKLAASGKVHSCVATSFVRYAYGRAEQSSDRCMIDGLKTAFEKADLSPRELLLAITQTDEFYTRAVPAGVAP